MDKNICRCGNSIECIPGSGRPRKFCTDCSPRRVRPDRQVQPDRPPHNCKVCGALITTKATVCSNQCKWKVRARKPCSRCGKPSGWPANSTSRGEKCICRACRKASAPPPLEPQNWVCANCGKSCTRNAVRGQVPKYCGRSCQQLASFHRRRARLFNAFVEEIQRSEIFLADGYRCYLCGRMTDKTKSYPHPKAPTIDHIIPLAKGGLHERSNCRTACARCNWAKQDRGGGEQFALSV